MTLCDPIECTTLGSPVLHYLPQFAQTNVHWVSDTIQPSHPLPLLPLTFLSIRVFSNESALHIRWPSYWSFSFIISSSNEHLGLISLRIGLFDLFVVQGTLQSQKNQFLGAQPFLRSNSHICTWLMEKRNKQTNTALTMLLPNNIVVWICCWSLLAKWYLCFIKCCLGLLIFFQEASFNFMAVVTICSDFGNQENKVCYCFHFFPIYLS